MNILPTDKHDIDACHRLADASDDHVISNIDGLLEWTKDINWPVAPLVINRIKTLGSELALPISKILDGNDSVWKYFLINYLLPRLSPELKLQLREPLQKLVEAPSENDRKEEVSTSAKEFLDGL